MSTGRDSQDEAGDVEYLPDSLPDRSALEKVLRETLCDSRPEPVHDKEMRALVAIAKRHAGAKLSLEPIGVELVESILRGRLTRIEAPPEYWRTMSTEIAASLLDAPTAKQRFLAFWNSLSEAAR